MSHSANGSAVGLRRLRADAVWREAGGEILAVDEDLRNYVSTNGTGTLLWRRLADGASADTLSALLSSTYGIARARAEQDVAAFLATLEAAGFLEPLAGRK